MRLAQCKIAHEPAVLAFLVGFVGDAKQQRGMNCDEQRTGRNGGGKILRANAIALPLLEGSSTLRFHEHSTPVRRR